MREVREMRGMSERAQIKRQLMEIDVTQFKQCVESAYNQKLGKRIRASASRVRQCCVMQTDGVRRGGSAPASKS